jgi:hypothetical protein
MAKSTDDAQPRQRETGRYAGPKLVCPNNALHQRVRVYRTKGTTRYCTCSDCGSHFKAVGDFATPVQTYLEKLADRLERAASSPQTINGQAVVVLGVDDVRRTAQQLRDSAEGLPIPQ